MAEDRKVTVRCGYPQGLVLRTFETRDIEGLPTAVPNGEQIVLNHGDNEGVNAARFEQWMEANKESDLVKSGLVFAAPELPEEGSKPFKVDQPPPVQPNVDDKRDTATTKPADLKAADRDASRDDSASVKESGVQSEVYNKDKK